MIYLPAESIRKENVGYVFDFIDLSYADGGQIHRQTFGLDKCAP